MAQIPELLAKGARAYGFHGDVWMASQVPKVIARTFGVRYHRDHVGPQDEMMSLLPSQHAFSLRSERASQFP